ncbi:MAG: type II toxin-antitoxin system VapC family toxin [Acidobacteriia bacterium]|nr:type II toxin-antitoxin system VapC family toxin [Terriglobia bacterium]
MKYLFDTNICIDVIRRRPVSLLQRMLGADLEEIGISTITLAELQFGAAKSAFPERNRIALIEFLTPFEILDFDQAAAGDYGKIRADLERRGSVIGPMDMLIAAQARSRDLILVTNNTREFRRIHDLKVENWVRG